jgi:hypothetical protein
MRSLALCLLLAGCTTTTIIVTPDGGAPSDASIVDAPLGTDAGPAPEPVGGSECDQQDDCQTCLTCSYAPSQRCNGLALACEDDADCSALVTCLNGCGSSDVDCDQACGAAHPGATALLRSFYECAICSACPADCRELAHTWCEAPPF